MADEAWINDAKARLAKVQPRTRRSGSIAARVEVLLPEIAKARAEGKTWEQIAADLSGDTALNSDAVRIGFARATKRVKPAPPVRNRPALQRAVSAAPAPKPIIPPVAPDPFEDMFAPMLDARDMRGRGTGTDGESNA